MDVRLQWILLFVVAYLLGAIPFGYLIGRMRGIDIREHGSKNIGATNTGRVLGKKAGMFCFILDVLKGLIPTLVAGILMDLTRFRAWQDVQSYVPSAEDQFLWIGVGLAAILGHMFPVYLQLKGGKGVATAFGVMLGIFPFLTWPALGAVVVWLGAVKIFRMISLASIVASASLPMWLIVGRIPRDLDSEASTGSIGQEVFKVWPFLIIAIGVAILIAVRHRSNIGRILAGTEPQLAPKSRGRATNGSE